MTKTLADWTACGLCNRGGRGNDPDKCSCGWKITEVNNHGCFIGTPIIGEPRNPPLLSRAKKNYQQFPDSDSGLSFAEWMGFKRNHRRSF